MIYIHFGQCWTRNNYFCFSNQYVELHIEFGTSRFFNVTACDMTSKSSIGTSNFVLPHLIHNREHVESEYCF